MSEQEYLTPREVARALRVHVCSVYRLLSDGRLAGVRRGGKGNWLISQEALDAFLVAPRGPAQTSTTRQSQKAHEQAMERLREAGYRV